MRDPGRHRHPAGGRPALTRKAEPIVMSERSRAARSRRRGSEFRRAANAILLACGIAGGLAGCQRQSGQSTAAAEVPQSGGTLRVLIESCRVFDPAAVDDAYESMIVNQVYEGLVRLDSDLGIRPGLARTWTVADEGRRYRFVLRDGVRFHDGSPLTARSVVASLERALAPERKGTCLAETYLLGIEGGPEYQAGRAASVSGLRAAGADTIEIRLAEPLSYFLSVMCMDQLKVVAELPAGESLDRHPVGTGPFRWVEQRACGDIVLARNDDYWGGKAFLDTLHFVVPDHSLSEAEDMAWLRESRVHVMPVSARERAQVEMMKGFQLVRFPDFGVSFIGLNRKHPPLDRLEVRQAIAMAIDRVKLLPPRAEGLINPATGILPPRMAGYQPTPKILPHDVERARALLAEAGFGAAHPLPVIDYYTGARDTTRYSRELIRQLGEAGIRLRFHTCDWAEMDAAMMAGRTPMFELSWLADLPDQDAIFYFLFHSGEPNNLFAYSDAVVDSMLEVGRRMVPGPRRFALYRQMESRIISQAPIIPTFSGTSLYVWHPRIRGIEPNPFGFTLTPFQKIWFAPEGANEPLLTEHSP
jgi:peptide/nickel transport system substrate-binding protein/oligopeptide transport system substrate-binding protein